MVALNVAAHVKQAVKHPVRVVRKHQKNHPTKAAVKVHAKHPVRVVRNQAAKPHVREARKVAH